MAIKGENAFFTLIRCDSDEGWREERRNGIGASDMGAVMGLSPWRSPYEVWLEKTGRVEPDDISDRPVVAFGNDFEETAGRNFEKEHSGSRVRRVNAMCQSIERPFVRASLDFECTMPGRDGWGVLEVKTSRDRAGFEGRMLPAYVAQATQQLYVTGRSWGVIWAFFRDTCEYGAYPVEPDADDLKAVTDAADSFWGFVERDEPPEMTGLESEARALAEQHAEPGDEWEVGGKAEASLVSELAEMGEAIKSMEGDRRRIQDRLKSAIGDSCGIEVPGYEVRWLRGQSSRFDRKAFERDHPELAARYTTTATRDMGLRVKAIG